MRATLERLSPVLIAAVLAGGFVVASALPAAADARDERRDRLHSERPTAAPQQVQFIDPDIAAQIDRAQGEADWIAAVVRAEAEAEAQAQAAAARSRAWVGSSSPSRGSCNGDVECFLTCTRSYESDTSGGYGAVSSGGTYRGAYQFAQPTWDAAVAGAGYGEYAGVPAEQVPAEIQDAAAAHLYSVSGTRPWGGRC